MGHTVLSMGVTLKSFLQKLSSIKRSLKYTNNRLERYELINSLTRFFNLHIPTACCSVKHMKTIFIKMLRLSIFVENISSLVKAVLR